MHQWSKNLLVFFPLFLAHQWDNFDKAVAAFVAFFGFSMAASCIYICNDLLDLRHDRTHPRKKKRVLANGTFDIYHLFWLLPLLFGAAVASTLVLPPLFAVTLLSYIAITSLYSITIKERAVLDVMTLAILYTLRLCAGAAATEVIISKWLLLFSMFLFLSLALIKRYAELTEIKGSSSRRGYEMHDLQLISSAGLASGYICSLVAVLYVVSPEVTVLYANPNFLLPIGILIVYWVTRLWLFALRGVIREDPVVFTFRDSASYVVFILCVVLIVLAAKA